MFKHFGLVLFLFMGLSSFADNSNKIFDQKLIDRIYENNANSIVSISSEKFDSAKNKFRETHRGTGIVIDSSGLILTAYHTVKYNNLYMVSFKNGVKIPSKRILVDENLDLALLQTEFVAGELIPVKFSTSGKLRKGEPVLSIGSPFEFKDRVVSGVISGFNRSISRTGSKTLKKLIQLNINLVSGMSGGPVFNRYGEVIGINLAKSRKYKKQGFVIPAKNIEKFLSGIMRPSVFRGQKIPFTFKTHYNKELNVTQVMIDSVKPGSLAESKGVKPGLLLNRIDGKEVVSAIDAARMIWNKKSGESLLLGTSSGDIHFPLRDLNGIELTKVKIGVDLLTISREIQKGMNLPVDKGLIIYNFDVEGVDLRRGDIIKRINGMSIVTKSDLKRVLEGLDKEEVIELIVLRNAAKSNEVFLAKEIFNLLKVKN